MFKRIYFLSIFIIFCLINPVSSAFAALNGAGHGEMKNVVFHVKTQVDRKSTLESLKIALNNIGYQIENNFKNKDQFKIFVVVHGDNLRWFLKTRIDTELDFMVRWLLSKGVDLRACNPCLEERNLSLANLADGFKSSMD